MIHYKKIKGDKREMKNQCTVLKEKLTIPKYTLSEELISAISHGIGTLLSIAALVLTVVASAKHHNAIAVVSSALYGTMLIILYTMSTLYHSFKPTCRAKKVFRVFDHCSIFLLIFGSYTPYVLVALNGTLRMDYIFNNISFYDFRNNIKWNKFGKV